MQTTTIKTPKKLSFGSVFLLGINGIIGSGIFLLPGKIYADLHNWSLLIILVAALATGMILLCFADLSSKFTGDGSSWIYTYNAYGRFAGFEVGFDTWVTGIIQLATETAALLTTMQLVFPAMKETVVYNATAVGIVAVLGIINLFGDGILSVINNIASVTKMAILALFIIGGAFFIHWANFDHPLTTPLGTTVTHFNSAFSVILIVFTGFSFLPVAAGQMDNSEKNLPRALVSVMVVTTVIYLLVQTVAIGLAGPALSDTSTPIAAAFKSAVGSLGYDVIVAGMLVSILGVAISLSFNTPTVAASLATEHQLLPSFIGKTNRHGSPYIAVAITVAAAAGLLVSGGYLFLVACVVITSFIQYIPTILATMKFRNNDHLPKTFKLRGGVTVPVLALLVSGYLMFSFTPLVLAVGAGTLIVGALLYLLDDQKDQQKHGQVAAKPASRT